MTTWRSNGLLGVPQRFAACQTMSVGWAVAVRKRSLVAFDRSQIGPDQTERRSNRASRSTDGSQHSRKLIPVGRARPMPSHRIELPQLSIGDRSRRAVPAWEFQ
jgi:hypothetical protein